MRRERSGFSLIELIIAISLATLVLVAIVNLSTSMVRFQMEGIRRGSVTGWALVSFTRMTRDIENANVLVYPTAGAANSDTLVACNNWSRIQPELCGAGDYRTDCSRPVEVLYYCFNPGAKTIWRYYNSSALTSGLACPTSPPTLPACDGTPTFPEKTQMAWNVERLAGQTMFTRDDSIGGVRIHYAVGEQAATANRPTTVFVPFEAGLSMQKNYRNSAD